MHRHLIAEEITRQSVYCKVRSPLYAELLRTLACDVRESPTWIDSLENAWRTRAFAVGWESVHLLLACLHFEALRGSAPEIAAVYPSCGGKGAHAGPAAKSFLRRARSEFWHLVASSYVQTNEIARSVVWMLAGAAAFGVRNMPFHLVELGTSAGLNLIGDRLEHDCRIVWETDSGAEMLAPRHYPLRVLSRTGLDIHPRFLVLEEDRVWLKACVWADDLTRMRQLDQATALFLNLARKRSGPWLERCAFSEAADWLAAHRPPTPHEGLLLFNSIATIYLDDREYGALQQQLAAVLDHWNGRALWVEYERARGFRTGPLEIIIHRIVNGRLDSRVVGYGEPRPKELRLSATFESCFSDACASP